METWRLLIDPSHPGASNMALDEALALSAADSGRNTLRLYSFDPPAITVGRFQRIDGFLDTDVCDRQGVGLTRRPTGGLAILHKDDFTYSVVSPRGATGSAGRDVHFRKIADGVTAALGLLGISAEVASHGEAALGRGWCFEMEHGVDIVWASRKICGSAQRMAGGYVLQHGSLFLSENEALLQELAPALGGRLSRSSFVTLDEACGRPVGWREVAEAFVSGFAGGLGVALEPGEFTPEERHRADVLEKTKYADREWVRGGS